MKALIIGGTGATGPYILKGLIERGYEVTILHGGFHEPEFAGSVEHLHGDPHFKETLEQTLGSRTFDLIIFTYGRLRIAVEGAKTRTGRFIAVGGSIAATARSEDSRWGPMGRPVNVSEDSNVLETNADASKFGYLAAISEEAVLKAHREGHFCTTYLGYPALYGPGAPAPTDWCVVRRILDGRKHLIVPDGGLKILGAGYVENVAHALLLAVDKPQVSGGKKYFMTDQKLYTMRQRIEFIARHMNHSWELVDMPFELAAPSHVLWGRAAGHHFRDAHKIQDELGYRDVVSTDKALEKTVDWLIQNRPQPGGEAELQLGDPFDYAKEDEFIEAWKSFRAMSSSLSYPVLPYAHAYRHPSKPNEPWKRPDDWVAPK